MSTIKDKSFITKISKLGGKMAQQSRAFVIFIDNSTFFPEPKLSVTQLQGI